MFMDCKPEPLTIGSTWYTGLTADDDDSNLYAQLIYDVPYLTAVLSHVTGGTKPDNQAEEEEDWEEGGVV